MTNTHLFLLLTLITLISCSPEESAQTSTDQNQAAVSEDSSITAPVTQSIICEAVKGLTPYCGFKNPEDMVMTPDNKQLIISAMGEFMTDSPGQLLLFDLAADQQQPLPIIWENTLASWGDSNCQAPDTTLFSPHGIDRVQRANGEHQLLVVNHGGRDAVEMFELIDTSGSWSLSWRGCVIPPEDPFLNDVSGLKDGGLLVTHMWNKSLTLEEVTAMWEKGETMGWVWEWHPDRGFKKLGGSDQLMPNGIAVSKDNEKVFVNIYLGNKIIKIDRLSGVVEGELEVQQPDNVVLDDAGNLWIASHLNDPINETCAAVKEGPCPLPFAIIKADSSTMTGEVVLTHSGAPMGYATVAFPAGDRLFMGSAHGDRMISMPLVSGD